MSVRSIAKLKTMTSRLRCRLYQYIMATLGLLSLVGVLASCSISYKFNGGAIDYTRVRSITLHDVTNRAPVVYPSFAPMLTERLKDLYTSRTRLDQVARDGDLELECTITGYDLSAVSVSADNYADRTSFAVTIQVKYTNRSNDKESFDRSFRAHRDFDRSVSFASVQDQLLEEITEDLIKQVFNATVENW